MLGFWLVVYKVVLSSDSDGVVERESEESVSEDSECATIRFIDISYDFLEEPKVALSAHILLKHSYGPWRYFVYFLDFFFTEESEYSLPVGKIMDVARCINKNKSQSLEDFFEKPSYKTIFYSVPCPAAPVHNSIVFEECLFPLSELFMVSMFEIR